MLTPKHSCVSPSSLSNGIVLFPYFLANRPRYSAAFRSREPAKLA